MDYVGRRLSSLPIAGAALVALLGAGVLESAGVPGPTAIAAGLVVFVATALAAEVTIDHRIRHRANGPR
jgi:hypothetical protein